jgi:hypothetical protein
VVVMPIPTIRVAVPAPEQGGQLVGVAMYVANYIEH